MNWIEKIQAALDYIEKNLLNNITIETVGKAIHYSPSSFQYLFRAVTGYTVGEYIRFRRLSCAVDELEKGKLSVTEISFKYGYETVEAFSKAFKRLYGVSPSKLTKSNSRYFRFAPIKIEFNLKGGFGMAKNYIPGLLKIDWSDVQRQNEFVNSVISALNVLDEKLDYDYVCAVSGNAFRTSFSKPSSIKWNHGNYHVIHTPIIIEHTFKMLGYAVKHHIRGDYEADKKLITDSIDRGVPVITLEGVINCADACVISGYDNDGAVLLGYSPFMDVENDHSEPHDKTGYFRKSGWHDGFFAEGSKGRILIIEGKCEKPSEKDIFDETLKLAARLIEDESLVEGQYNGLAAHRAFAEALTTYEWDDNFEPYLNVMCNYKQYIDRRYAAKFLHENGRDELAQYYNKITELSQKLGEIIPQDFSAVSMFDKKEDLKPFAEALLEICGLENAFLARIK